MSMIVLKGDLQNIIGILESGFAKIWRKKCVEYRGWLSLSLFEKRIGFCWPFGFINWFSSVIIAFNFNGII